MSYEAATQIAAALTIGLGGMLPAFAIGWMASKAMEAIGRNPDASGVILAPLIMSIAFAEAIGIYALVVALAIKFVPVAPLG
ncbi:MAG TPA: ATP synthase F0 subunit C [Anaerolineae bacterium]|jgi:F-type H+-transporting ATPase subunit c|nr:ATP synthase F0 subunit C [Anaerolineae bacterium]